MKSTGLHWLLQLPADLRVICGLSEKLVYRGLRKAEEPLKGEI